MIDYFINNPYDYWAIAGCFALAYILATLLIAIGNEDDLSFGEFGALFAIAGTAGALWPFTIPFCIILGASK